MATAMDEVIAKIKRIQIDARENGHKLRPIWPMIILRSPKGWTGPRMLEGKKIEGTFRSHQVPLAHVREKPEELQLLEAWMRSYRPEELFNEEGKLRPEYAGVAPTGDARMG